MIEDANPYIRPPQMGKLIETNKDDIIGKCMLMGPIHSEGQESIVKYIAQGSIAVVPIIAMDFSLANLTFSEDQCLHSTKPYKKCDYRDVLRSLFESFKSNNDIPIFGYSAKTAPYSANVSHFFPLTRNLNQPLIYNTPMNVTEQYTECLKNLELGTPINLGEVFNKLKKIAEMSKE